MGGAPDIAVWRISLDSVLPPSAAALAEQAPERARAQRFATEGRHCEIAGWLRMRAMRRILAAPAGGEIDFNLSDSGDLVLLAVSRCGPVGVDVEWCRPGRDLLEIAESFFADEELKEALIRALGLGLQLDLKRFAASSEPDNPRFLRVDADARLQGSWTLWNVPVPDGSAGTLVARPNAVTYRLCRLESAWPDADLLSAAELAGELRRRGALSRRRNSWWPSTPSPLDACELPSRILHTGRH